MRCGARADDGHGDKKTHCNDASGPRTDEAEGLCTPDVSQICVSSKKHNTL